MPANPTINVIKTWTLPYEERLAARSADKIDLVVIHCTELPDLAMARNYGERVLHEESQTGNSGHYYIDRDGSVSCFVRPERTANHTRGHDALGHYNTRSIGIELVNTGRFPDWFDSRHQAMDEPYTEAQIAALIALLNALRSELPNLHWIAGHEDLDTARVPATDDSTRTVARKRDPGALFPWSRVLAAVPLQRMDASAQS